MRTRAVFLLVLLLTGALVAPAFADGEIDRNLMQKVSGILMECGKIKPGTTRADFLKVFTTEGGLSTATHRTFVHRRCPYVKVDVEFRLSKHNKNGLDEQPADTVTKISKPYLEWGIQD